MLESRLYSRRLMRFLQEFSGKSRKEFFEALEGKAYQDIVAIYRTNESTAVSYMIVYIVSYVWTDLATADWSI